MFLNSNTDPHDHSSYDPSYNERAGWREATWHSYVELAEAMRGAEAYLPQATQVPCAFLLNNNSPMSGS